MFCEFDTLEDIRVYLLAIQSVLARYPGVSYEVDEEMIGVDFAFAYPDQMTAEEMQKASNELDNIQVALFGEE